MAECGSAAGVQFGGLLQPGRAALLGLHESAWAQLGMTPARWIGVLGVSKPAAVWYSSNPLAPVVPRLTNFPRTVRVDTRRFTVSGDAPADHAVLVSSRAHRYAPFDVIGARVDGQDVQPGYRDVTAVVFLAPQALRERKAVHWDIDIEATAEYVDVLTFASGP